MPCCHRLSLQSAMPTLQRARGMPCCIALQVQDFLGLGQGCNPRQPPVTCYAPPCPAVWVYCENPQLCGGHHKECWLKHMVSLILDSHHDQCDPDRALPGAGVCAACCWLATVNLDMQEGPASESLVSGLAGAAAAGICPTDYVGVDLFHGLWWYRPGSICN